MGVLGQLGLLLRKNLKLRIRSPILTLTQLLWPVVLFVVIAAIRGRYQPVSIPNCYYDAKAMPSRGLVPFMQSFMCDLSTSCKSEGNMSARNGNELPSYHSDARIAQISDSLHSVFSSNATVESLIKLPQTIKPLAELSDVINSDALKNLTEKKYMVSEFFHNASDVRRHLMDVGLDAEVVDAMLKAQLDVYQLLELAGFVDFKGIVCNATRLNRYLTFPPGVSVDRVSAALCDVPDDKIPIIVDELQKQLDIPYLINEFSQFLKAIGQTDWSGLLQNTSSFLEQLEGISDLGDFVEGLPNLLEIVRLTPVLRDLFYQFEQGTLEKQLDIAFRLMETVDAQLVNMSWWSEAKNVVGHAQSMLGTLTEYMHHLEDNVVRFGTTFKNVTTVAHLLKEQFDITAEDVQVIMQLQIIPEKLPELLQLLAFTDSPADLVCNSKKFNISEFVRLPPGSQDADIDSVHNLLCKTGSNGNLLLQFLFNNTDVLRLVDQVNRVINSPPPPPKWDSLMSDIMAISEGIQKLPDFFSQLPVFLESFGQLAGSFQQMALSSMDWTKLLDGSFPGDLQAFDALGKMSADVIGPILQESFSQTALWPSIQHNLIGQHMLMDIQITIGKMLTGGSCPDGWHSNGYSCYKYVHEVTPNFFDALFGCFQLHSFGHPVFIDHEQEQKFIENFGENTLSWISPNDGRFSPYQNWASPPPATDPMSDNWELSCAKANFGTDGLWHHANCSKPADSYLCEAVQYHKLVELVGDEPFGEITQVLLELGPNVTEAVLQAFMNSSYIESLFQMPLNGDTPLCNIDLSKLPSSIDVAEVRQRLCSVNVTRILEDQMEYWQIPELEAKFREYLDFLHTDPTMIPEEYVHLANFTTVIRKNSMVTELWTEVFSRPFSLQPIMEKYADIVSGDSKEWALMFERVLNFQSSSMPGLPANHSIVDVLQILNAELGQILAELDLGSSPSLGTVVRDFLLSTADRRTSILEMINGGQGQLGAAVGSLFPNETLLKKVLEDHFNLSAQMVSQLQSAVINVRKIPELVEHLMMTQPDLALSSLCQSNISDLFVVLGDDFNTQVLEEVLHSVLCSTNTSAGLLRTLLSQMNLTAAMSQLGGSGPNPMGPVHDLSLLIKDIVNLTDSVQDLPSFLQKLPSLLDTFQSRMMNLGDWGHILSGLHDGNMTLTKAMEEFAPVVTLLESYLAQTDAWPAIQQQLIYQNLVLDVNLAVTKLLTGGTCKDGWHSNDIYCYRYVDGVNDAFEAYSQCYIAHLRSYVTTVDSKEEQLYLQSIGEDKLTWIAESPYGYGEMMYQNWANQTLPQYWSCTQANFGTDGLWYYANCSQPLQSVLCKATQDHILISRLQDQPFNNITSTLLKLGPNITAAVVKAFTNPTKFMMFLNMSHAEQSSVLCREDFVILPPTDTASRQALCSLDLWRILNEQMAYWNAGQVEAAIGNLQAFLQNPNASYIPPEFASYANLSEVVRKNELYTALQMDAQRRPFWPSALWEDSGMVVTGTESEWLEMFIGLGDHLNEAQTQWMEVLFTMYGLDTSSLQYNAAVQNLQDTLVRAANQLFIIIQELGAGRVFDGSMPETERFLRGLMGLIDQGPAILDVIHQSWEDPAKYELIASSDIRQLFCNDTKRRSLLGDGHSINTTALDEYLCLVNFHLLAQELQTSLLIDEISALAGWIIYPNGTMPGMAVSSTDFMKNVEVLINNFGSLPSILASFDARYNMSSLATIAEALFQSVIMSYGSTVPMDATNEMAIVSSLLNNPELVAALGYVADGTMVDLQEIQAYIAFANQYIEWAKENSCQEGWNYFDRSCYKVMNGTAALQQAERKCLDQQTELLDVQSQEEQTFLQSFGPDTDVWTHFYSTLTYTNLAPGQADPGWGNVCLRVNFRGDSLWYYTDCNSLQGYICEAIPELKLTLRMLIPFTNQSSIRHVIDIVKQSLGPETVDTVLSSPINPLQLSRLVVGQDWRAAVCSESSLRALFMFPNSFNVTHLRDVLCGDIFLQVMLDLYNSTDTFDLFLSQIDAFRGRPFNATSFVQDIETLIEHLPALGQFKLNAYVPLNYNPFGAFAPLNGSTWESVWSTESMYLNMPNVLDTALMNEAWYSDVVREIRSMAYFSEYFSDKILVLQGKHLVLPEIRNLLANITETEKLFDVIGNFTPELFDSMLSLVVRQDKLAEFLTFGNPLATLCAAGNFSLYLTVPANSSVDLAALEGAICSVDLMQVVLEMKEVFPFDTFMAEYLKFANTSSSDNLTSLTERFMAVYMKSMAFIQDPLSINVNETWFKDTFDEVAAILTQWGNNQVAMQNTQGISSSLASLQDLQAMFGNESWWKDIQGSISQVISAIEYIDMKLKPLPGKNMTFFDVLPPASAELLEMLMSEFPDIVGILTHSNANYAKLAMLSGPNEFFTAVCVNGTSLTEFFYFQPAVNLTYVHSVLCSFDYLQLPNEWSQEVGVIMQAQQGPPLNWTSAYETVMSLVETLSQLSQNPPQLAVYDAQWFHEKLLQTDAILQTLYPMGTEMSLAGLNYLLPMLDSGLMMTADYYNVLITQLRVDDYINTFFIDQISMLMGQNWTLPSLEGLFTDAENVRSLLALLEVSPDIVDGFLSLSVHQPDWSVFWTTPDPFATLCSTDQFAAFFEVPTFSSQSNLTAIQQAICAIDVTLLDQELSQYYNLSKIQIDLERIMHNDSSLGPFNWTSWITNRDRVSQAIEQLVLSPPKFMVDSAWSNDTITRLHEVLNGWSMTYQQMVTMDQANSSAQLLQALQQVAGVAGSAPYLEIFRLVLEGTVREMNRQEALLSVYLNYSVPVAILMDSFSLDTDELLLSLANVFDIYSLALYRNKPGYWEYIFCNETRFTTLYTLPPAVNSTAVHLAMCSLNQTEFFDKINLFYQIDFLKLQPQLEMIFGPQGTVKPFDQEYLQQYAADIEALLTELMRYPDFMMGESMHNMTGDLDSLLRALGKHNIMAILDALRIIHPYFEDDGVVVGMLQAFQAYDRFIDNITVQSTLELIEAEFRQAAGWMVWYEVEPYLEAGNLVLDGVLAGLHPGGVAIPGFLYNQTVLDRVIEAALQMASSEFVKALTIGGYSPQSLSYFHLSGTWDMYLCDPQYYTQYYPLGLNATIQRLQLCDLDRDLYFETLNNITGLDMLHLHRLIFQLRNILPKTYNETLSFGWDSVISKVESIGSVLQGILGLPGAGNNGNMAEAAVLLQELQEGLSHFSFKFSVELLEQLDVLMGRDGPWPLIQEYVTTATDIARLLDQQKEFLTGSNQTIEGIFLKATPDFFSQFLAPEHVQALMSASISPALISALTQPSNLTTILCDTSQFNQYITLPPGADAPGIQSALCSLAMTNETFLHDLMAVFNIGLIQEQIQKLLSGNYTAMGVPNMNWQETILTLQQLVSSLTAPLPHGQDFLGDFFMRWLAMSAPMETLPPALANLTMDYTSLCQSLSPELLNTTAWQSMIAPALTSSKLAMQIMDNLIFTLPSHQQELQTILNNMSMIVELINVTLEVQQSLMEAGIAVLLDGEKLAWAMDLVPRMIQGSFSQGIVCDPTVLGLVVGIPSDVNLTDVSALLCGVEKLANTQAIQEVQRIVGLSEILPKISTLFSGGPMESEAFDCPSMVKQSQYFMEKLMTVPSEYATFINTFEAPVYFDVIAILPELMRSTSAEDMQSLTELYHLVQPLIGPLLGIGNQGNSTQIDDMLLPYLDMIDSYLKSQLGDAMYVELSSLWSNTSELRQYLSHVEGFSPEVIDAIINGKLNTSVLSQLQGEITDQLCSNSKLYSQLFVFNDSSVALEVQNALCGGFNGSSEALGVLSGSLNITELISAITMTAPMAVAFPEYLNELLTALEGLNNLDPALVENFTTHQWPMVSDGFLNSTDIISLAMNATELIKIAKSFRPVIDVLRPALGEDPTFQKILALFDSLDKFDGLLNLVSQLPDLSLRKLFKNPDDFQTFLVEEVGFSQLAAAELLTASLSLDVAASANFSTVNGIVCNQDELTSVVKFPEGTNVTHVIQTLCSLDTNQLSMVLDGVMQQLNVGTLIQELLTNSLLDSLGNNTSLKDLAQAGEDLKPIQDSLQTITAEFETLGPNAINVDDLVDSIMGNTAAQSSPSTGALSDFICGEGVTISLPTSDSVASASRRRRSLDTRRKRSAESLDKVPGATPFCASLYESIQTVKDGQLIWHYIKPILLGKIPYAPDNMATAKIVKEASFFFKEISTIRDLGKAWLAGSKDLKKLIGADQLILLEKFLSNSYTKEIIQEKLGLDPDTITAFLDMDLSGTNSTDALGEFDQMAELAVNLTDCIDLDRFVPLPTESALDSRSRRYSGSNTLFGGVFFSNIPSDAEVLPPHVQYKIRMDIENTPSTKQLKDNDWTAGPNNRLIDQLYSRGFIFLQDMIEKGIIKSQTDSNVATPGVYIQLMPYPCHVVDSFVERFTYLLPLMLTFVFMSTLATMVYQLVYEKELGIEELMKAMGLRSGVNLFCWFLNNLILMALLCLIMTIVLKVGNILPSTDAVLLFVFMLCFSFSLIMMCYMISTLFQKASVASVAAVLIYLMTYIPYIAYLSVETKLDTFHQTALFSLSSTCAFTLGCNEIALKEAQTVGVQWDAFAEGFHQFETFSFNWLCMAMLWDGLLYFVIGWYISAIYPGRHGVPKPWYFIFLPWTWCGFSLMPSSSNGELHTSVNKNPDVDLDPTNHPLGISIVGLTKKYGRKKAVDNLTLNFYEDQITSFLGQNGAGKTTTISIIMGLFPAYSGKVFIYGKDVMQRLHSIRKELGVCPQHNALYDQLTVREHLELFGRLKGMSSKDIYQQSQELIGSVGLQNSANEKVCNLSGGMKRKLSVMIAFLGGSNIVILDEPTSGVDPHARRSIWDLIIKNKQGRTILLCTHFMDEADLLGDRIAILDEGQLRCCGSSAFLKNRFGSGYTLTVAKRSAGRGTHSTPEKSAGLPVEDQNQNRAVENIYTDLDKMNVEEAEEAASTSSRGSSSGVSSMEENFNTNKLTSLIQSHLPSAILKEDTAREVSYTLPASFEHTSKFQGLFQELDAKLPEMHASSYGLSDATLEEVFLKVSSPDDESARTAKDITKMVPEATLKRTKVVYKTSPSSLRQFLAILAKRFHYAKRDWLGMIWALLVPTLWLLLAILFSSLETAQTNSALHFAPSLYGPGDYVFFSNSDSQTAVGDKMTNALFNEPGLGTTCMKDFENSTTSTCQFTEPFFDRPISALTEAEHRDILIADRQAPDCSCTDKFLDCPEGAAGSQPPEWIMNTTDILLDTSLKVDLNEYLLKTTVDFRYKRYNGLSFHTIKNASGDAMEVVKAWYNNKGFHAMPTALNTINNVILRSFLPESQDPAEYGISAYNHPYQFSEGELTINALWDQTAKYFGVSMLILVAFALIPSTFVMFPVLEYNNGSKRLHYISGITPFGYWLANLIWDMLMYLIPIAISLIIVVAFSMQAYSSSSNILAFFLLLLFYGFAVVCQMYLVVPFFKTTGSAFIVLFCFQFLVALLTTIPKFLQESPLGTDINEHNAFFYIDKVFLIFSPYCLMSGLVDLVYNQAQADIFDKFGVDTYRDPLGPEVLRWKLVALVVEGAAAFLLLLIIEYKCRYFCTDCKSGSNDHHGLEDEDVAMETKRVASGEARKDIVSIEGLTKVYRSVNNSSLVAVDDLHLGIPRGECFGLLGVNGAGKTSTFRMIIKDLIPTKGRVRILSDSIGYCPQVDALYNPLTGTELLNCYARIKGITGKERKLAVKRVTLQMEMQKYINKVIRTYSGGMKRSLSTAVALLGNPQIVLMDEPTTGMDPVTKQTVWCNILAMIQNGHSVILTSHSMEECELLCTRLAIMVNGRFRCLGSPQHVKHRHGDGYTLVVRINEETPNVNAVLNFVNDHFPDARLKEQHQNMVRYQLPMTRTKLADVFGAVEANKSRLGIQEYSVSQTTLDQVFVNFAKRQMDRPGANYECRQDYTNQIYSEADEVGMEPQLV